MAKTTELDVLPPIADHATAGYAAILDRGNLNDAEVLKELVRKSVVPALHYVNTEVFLEYINQVGRMEAIVLGPIHVRGNGVNEEDVDRLVSRYRFFVLPRFTGCQMKNELPAYRAAVAMIKSLEEREDSEGNGTFCKPSTWKCGGKFSGVTCARGPLCCSPCSAMCRTLAPRSARLVS